MCDVLTPCSVCSRQASAVVGVTDGYPASIDWKRRGEKRKERVTARCVCREGGYDRLSNSPQDTSHTSLVGSEKENGSYVCHLTQHTHTHTHTILPQLPLSCPLSWQVDLCWQAPLSKGVRESKERGRRKVMVRWTLGEFRRGRRTEEEKQREGKGGTTSHGTRQNETCLLVICHTL